MTQYTERLQRILTVHAYVRCATYNRMDLNNLRDMARNTKPRYVTVFIFVFVVIIATW